MFSRACAQRFSLFKKFGGPLKGGGGSQVPGPRSQDPPPPTHTHTGSAPGGGGGDRGCVQNGELWYITSTEELENRSLRENRPRPENIPV